MKFNDYELVMLSREGNENATNLIYQKYKPIIIKKSTNAFRLANHHGIDINDIIQECYIALDEAIRSFNQNEDATFYTFANLCIDRKITVFIRKSTNNKSKILNDAVTLDDVLRDRLGDNISIEKDIINKDAQMDRISLLRKELTNFELTVFDLRVNGYDFDEIAIKLNKDLKAIYNAFGRIKNKYKKINKIDN